MSDDRFYDVHGDISDEQAELLSLQELDAENFKKGFKTALNEVRDCIKYNTYCNGCPCYSLGCSHSCEFNSQAESIVLAMIDRLEKNFESNNVEISG